MIRQERRFAIRELQRELKQITGNKSFSRIMNDDIIARLSPEEISLLQNHQHTNKKLQSDFDFGSLLLARVKELETEIRRIIATQKVYPDN